MLSIFIIYSNDRKRELTITIACLREMDMYKNCQKILCVDEHSDIKLTDFDIICVKRKNNDFNWAAMWNAAISIAKFENILYLDSDRILPKNYLNKVILQLQDNKFIYSKFLFRLHKFCKLEMVKKIRDNPYKYKDFWYVDGRMPHPPNLEVLSFGKNPMSGNTAFTKKTWIETGGIDPSFNGWGFPDTDYYFRMLKIGMNFEIIDCAELHLYHDYAVDKKIFKLMNLWNAHKLATKFNIELDEDIKSQMERCNVTRIVMSECKTMSEFLNIFNKKRLIYL